MITLNSYQIVSSKTWHLIDFWFVIWEEFLKNVDKYNYNFSKREKKNTCIYITVSVPVS